MTLVNNDGIAITGQGIAAPDRPDNFHPCVLSGCKRVEDLDSVRAESKDLRQIFF
jgi:hypothetical protein